MADELYLRKSHRFSAISVVTHLSNNPTDYPLGSAHRKKMKKVADTSLHASQLGAWFVAECLSVITGDPVLHIGKPFIVYLPLTALGGPLQDENKPAAAPCPPFCGGDENVERVTKNVRKTSALKKKKV